MATYDLRGLSEDFVIHYGGESTEIDAFTLSNSLLALGGALQAINKEINPGFSLEISVIALGEGSFRPQLKTRAKRIGSLILGDFRQGIVTALAAVIVTKCITGDPSPQTIIKDSHVEIHNHTGDVIILPKEMFDSFRKVERNTDVNRSVRQAFEVLEEDDAVKSFGLARSLDEREKMPVDIDRRQFSGIARSREEPADGQRSVVELNASLQIVRAIFEDSTRRWQFVWQGIRISAPVLDADFRQRIVHREVSITHGDYFTADLRILQTADKSGIWINDSYEVINVHEHRTGSVQPDLLR